MHVSEFDFISLHRSSINPIKLFPSIFHSLSLRICQKRRIYATRSRRYGAIRIIFTDDAIFNFIFAVSCQRYYLNCYKDYVRKCQNHIVLINKKTYPLKYLYQNIQSCTNIIVHSLFMTGCPTWFLSNLLFILLQLHL